MRNGEQTLNARTDAMISRGKTTALTRASTRHSGRVGDVMRCDALMCECETLERKRMRTQKKTTEKTETQRKALRERTGDATSARVKAGRG
eukprot:EW704776.1.p3 GENE.EW704776.1~~EW704776.1.p3  ORF type:complete len:91 (-),score=5.41 EW704776.1:82-354(-)